MVPPLAHDASRVFPATTIILPAYDEEHGVGVVLERLRSVIGDDCEIIVVDDGSKDQTAAAAEACGARVYRHATNLGKGAAMLTGLAQARGEKIVFMDADDTYPVEAVPGIIRALDTSDVVLTVREHGRVNISPFNRFGNAIFRMLIGVAAGGPVRDPLSGLYGVQRRHLLDMALVADRFTVEAEIVIKALRMQLSVEQHPIAYRERIGESKLSPIRDGLAIARTSLHVWRTSRSSPTMQWSRAGRRQRDASGHPQGGLADPR
jgi:glycosyltransferase involved in cell wall biosynthesis